MVVAWGGRTEHLQKEHLFTVWKNQVLEKKAGYLAEHLPAEYLASPMLLVESWDELLTEMQRLVADPAALAARRRALLAWYESFMKATMRDIEAVLEARAAEPARFCASEGVAPR